eukprot:TRINITY_DN4024_c0_g1_i32.p1 TRINITY_DN4024_c0_g1~~TRINITY_DN4024_c0_g1_i32.p1  ORF type:complete len:147 (-),score=27.20 TRINITY_DN4024_c0_g1_i32:2-442(-)
MVLIQRCYPQLLPVTILFYYPNIPPKKRQGSSGINAEYGSKSFRKMDGETFSFGYGQDGQLGLGSGEEHNVAIPTAIPGLEGKGVRSLSCGYSHVAISTETGELYTFGNNNHYQLGRSRRCGAATLVDSAVGIVKILLTLKISSPT